MQTLKTYLSVGHRIAGNEELGINVVQIPFEAFALEIVTMWIVVNRYERSEKLVIIVSTYRSFLRSLTSPQSPLSLPMR